MTTAIKSGVGVIGKPSKELAKKVKAALKPSTGPQPRADIKGWVLCPGDNVLIVSPGEEYHGLFGKVDAFPTVLELSSYVQIDGRPTTSGRVLLPNAMLRWMGPDEAQIDLHRPTRPGQRVRVVLDNEALATSELKSMEGKLGTVTELSPSANSSMVTVRLDDPAELPVAINSFDLLVVPIPVVQYVPEPEEVPAIPEAVMRLSTKAWDALETIASIGGECWPKDFTTPQGKESIAELLAAGLLAGADGYYLLTGAGRAALPDAESPAPAAPVASEQPTEFRNIPLEQIAVTRNTRQVFDETALGELAQSIKERGVIAPIVVRRYDIEGPFAYELVAGERRLRASKLAGLLEIPAMVRVLDDRAFIEVQLLENLQRQDVRPSDEAQAFAELLNKHSFTAEEIALKVGKPVKFVLQRAKLVTLTPFWMEALEQERLPLAAAHELARLPEAGQGLLEEAAMKGYDTKRPDAVFTTQWVRSGISQWVLADLNAAFFRKNDATLFPKAGACTTCPKRSGACQGLFDEVELKHDYCLDKPCFEQKKTNLVERHKEALRNQTGKKAVLISSNYYQVPAGILDCYRYKEAKQEDPGAVQAVMIDGAEMGRIKWVVLKASSSTDSSKDKEADAARLRKERLTKTHRALIAEKLTADLPAAVATQGPVYESILTWLLLVECGTAKSTLAYLSDSWGWEPTEADIRNDYNDKDERGFRPWHRFVLRMIGPLSLAQRMELYLSLMVRHRMDYDYEDRQFTIAKLVNGLGYPELEAEAEKAIVARYYTKKGAKQ